MKVNVFKLVLFSYYLSQLIQKEVGELCGSSSQVESQTDCASGSEGNNTCCLVSYSKNAQLIKECRTFLNQSPQTIYDSYISIIKSFPLSVTESNYYCGTETEDCMKKMPNNKEECTSISMQSPYACCYVDYNNIESLCFPVVFDQIGKYAKAFQSEHNLDKPPSVICKSMYILINYFTLLIFVIFI